MSNRSRRLTQRNDLIRRINNLQQAKAHIEDECDHLNQLLENLTIETSVDHESVSSIGTSTTRTYPRTRRQPARERDSSFDRISGISAAPLVNGIENFDRSPPFGLGDILRITNRRNNDYGKAGVFDKRSPTFIYFSNDKNNWHRAPHNLQRIHITEYFP